MVLSEVVEKLGSGFVSSSITLVTGAAENVINVFFPDTTMETPSVDTLVLGGLLVHCWGPVVDKLCKLKASAGGEVFEGRSQVFPIDIVECGVGPVGRVRDDGDETFAESRSSGSSCDKFILFLGFKLAFVKEGSTSSRDPIGEVAYMPWVVVVGFSADIVSKAVSMSL